MPTTAWKQVSQLVVAPPTTGDSISVSDHMPSSVEVSRSIPQSGVSPVLTKYKQYLQSCYNARTLAPADKYLPTLEAPYINLAMIRRGQYSFEQRDEFTRRTLHGGVDQILQNKEPISIEDLLTPIKMAVAKSTKNRKVSVPRTSGPKLPTQESHTKPVRFILVEGPPGIGKSTFAWEVCRRWDEVDNLRHYHTVVLLKLRERWVLNATSLSDLFRYPFQPEFSKEIAQELHDSHGHNLLLVLDGFDEVSHSFHRNSVIKSILCKELLPECTIILTTRPVAKATLKSICQPQVDKHIEIIGFTEEERVRYITEVFSKEPELQVNFLKYMFLVPHIKSMMYIPLNCAIIAQVYYESQSSHYLAIPRTRTQLYKALTHSILVRYMKAKESNREYMSMLPDGLDKYHKHKFNILTKFAFNNYHENNRKVTFFKEDIPEELIHFGFMNESTEMYAGKGVEQTLSFLHLSLQEYLAAWHLANNYSIEFQMAYHRLALAGGAMTMFEAYKDNNKKEKALLLSLLQKQSLLLVEPAIFMAGITGWRSISRTDWNKWEQYLRYDAAHIIQENIIQKNNYGVLLQSLYEAQNPNIISHYFGAWHDGQRRVLQIDSNSTPYGCYALSYCLAHSSALFSLDIDIRGGRDVSCLETFVKGLDDHLKSTRPRVEKLKVNLIKYSNKCLYWLIKANCWAELNNIIFVSEGPCKNLDVFLRKLDQLQHICLSIKSWEWIPALKSLIGREIKQFHISDKGTKFFTISKAEAILDIELCDYTLLYHIYPSVYATVDLLFKTIFRSNVITKMELAAMSRETMAGVRGILLHCPNLASLMLKRTELGYDGILYICSALRKNTMLTHLKIDDDNNMELEELEEFSWVQGRIQFSFAESVALPGKTTVTEFLLELNNILKNNTTLKEMKIQSGLFFPIFHGEYGKYRRWTGLGYLQQFNVGAVGSGMSPNLRRSFSSSDLTQPQIHLFWKTKYKSKDFMKVLSKKTERKLFPFPPLTAPDTEVLQSFSGLDPRLKECLEISHLCMQYQGGTMFQQSYLQQDMDLPPPVSLPQPLYLPQPAANPHQHMALPHPVPNPHQHMALPHPVPNVHQHTYLPIPQPAYIQGPTHPQQPAGLQQSPYLLQPQHSQPHDILQSMNLQQPVYLQRPLNLEQCAYLQQPACPRQSAGLQQPGYLRQPAYSQPHDVQQPMNVQQPVYLQGPPNIQHVYPQQPQPGYLRQPAYSQPHDIQHAYPRQPGYLLQPGYSWSHGIQQAMNVQQPASPLQPVSLQQPPYLLQPAHSHPHERAMNVQQPTYLPQHRQQEWRWPNY